MRGARVLDRGDEAAADPRPASVGAPGIAPRPRRDAKRDRKMSLKTASRASWAGRGAGPSRPGWRPAPVLPGRPPGARRSTCEDTRRDCGTRSVYRPGGARERRPFSIWVAAMATRACVWVCRDRQSDEASRTPTRAPSGPEDGRCRATSGRGSGRRNARRPAPRWAVLVWVAVPSPLVPQWLSVQRQPGRIPAESAGIVEALVRHDVEQHAARAAERDHEIGTGRSAGATYAFPPRPSRAPTRALVAPDAGARRSPARRAAAAACRARGRCTASSCRRYRAPERSAETMPRCSSMRCAGPIRASAATAIRPPQAILQDGSSASGPGTASTRYLS